MSPEKGGGLRAQSTGGRRLLVGSVLSLGLLGVPLLLLGTGATLSAAPGGAVGGRVAADASARPRTGFIGNLKLAFELPAAAATTTDPPTTTTTGPPPTTTAPRPTAPPTTAPPTNTATGIATWYSESPPGGCASPWLPRGVTLTVTDITTGVTLTCLVDDREADNPGRVVDLSPSEFEELAPLSEGVVQVTVSW
jgi:hypothetical protein